MTPVGQDEPVATPPSDPSTPIGSLVDADPAATTGAVAHPTAADPERGHHAELTAGTGLEGTGFSPGTGPADGADPAESATDAADKAGASSSALFGRGMLYVVVSSLQLLTGALASPILAHLLGDPAEFGRLSSAIALHQLLIVVAIVGLDQAIVLKRSEDGHDGNVRALASTSIMLATAVTALLWLTAGWWAPLFGFDAGSQLALITVLWTIPSAGVMVQLALLLTADRLKPYAVVSVLAAVGGQVAGIVAVLIFGRQAAIYAWGLLGADLVAAVIGWSLTRPTLKRAFSWSLLKPSLALGTPLMFGALSMFVLNAGDRIIIQRELGPAEVGRYQVAYTVGFVAVQMIGLTSKAWTPRFAAIRDRTLRWQIIGSSRDSIYALLSPVVLGIILAAPLLLRIVAPSSFRPETLLMVTLLVLIGAYPVAASGASSRMLITSRRARPLATWMAIAATVNV
ncbi:MAG: oligosaccharide flippase family protein, partial [Nakamurella sp.]